MFRFEMFGLVRACTQQYPLCCITRFSVSHDEVSLGNTSDNLEAVSEAASNHSVTSSMELETEDQNDNLSDMVRLFILI